MKKYIDPQLETKPDFMESMSRIYAWYDHEVLDRVPIRFIAHNANAQSNDIRVKRHWTNLKERWYDVEYQLEVFMDTLYQGSYLGETFPIYWPNLGPNVFAAMLGADLEFGEVTSWAHANVRGPEDLDKVRFLPNNEYLTKINELTDAALELCENKFIVGYTDMHPSLDCADALLGTENLFAQMVDDPDFVLEVLNKSLNPFFEVMDGFHEKLKKHHQPSVTWMNIPSFESVHIPSCDMSSMISSKMFETFVLPYILKEVKHFHHNIFHVDGKGVARHIDMLLEIPEIQAFQWVQGVGLDRPIMQWVPFIKKIQAAGKSVLVDLYLDELEPFMDAVHPKGILLSIPEYDPEIQQAVLNRLLKWK